MDYDDTNHSDDDDDEVDIPTATSSYSSPPKTLDPPKTTPNTSTSAEATHLAVQRLSTPSTTYKECLKNHAVGIGGHAVDGCGEFLPAPHDPLSCAACGCHRNFHRKETNGAATLTPIQHPQFSPYYRTAPAGYLHHHHHFVPPQPRPLALPSTSGGGAAPPHDDVLNAGGMAGTSSRKRYRTKFTPEQKERMLEFAERVGWRIQRHDEGLVQQFCDETGLRRHVLKVWMHNNKHTLGKKP